MIILKYRNSPIKDKKLIIFYISYFSRARWQRLPAAITGSLMISLVIGHKYSSGMPFSVSREFISSTIKPVLLFIKDKHIQEPRLRFDVMLQTLSPLVTVDSIEGSQKLCPTPCGGDTGLYLYLVLADPPSLYVH